MAKDGDRNKEGGAFINRIMIVHLLEKEALLFPSHCAPASKSDPWRGKVIRWFFSVVSALGRNQQDGVQHPFDRATVHVTTALMDSYLASLPCERSAKFRRDRVAYQVLATSCLLLGMRLVHHHRKCDTTRQQVGVKEEPSKMKRTSKLHENMDQQARANGSDANVLEIPDVNSILRISAASISISEASILTMVREITSSRIFPRSHSVTALDFIQSFASRNSENLPSSSNGTVLHLEPSQQRNASMLADAGLFCSGCKPSTVACAAITVAMLRSVPEEDMASVRQMVFRSVFGEHDELSWQAVQEVERRLLRLSSRNGHRVPPRTPLSAHVIPQED